MDAQRNITGESIGQDRKLRTTEEIYGGFIKSINSGGYPSSILERIPLVGSINDKAIGVGYVDIITVRTPVVILKEPEERPRKEELLRETAEAPEELKNAMWRFVQALSSRERLEIINIAIRALGYPETPLSEIAEELGYSERALYSIVQGETTRVRARKLYESLLMLSVVAKSVLVDILRMFTSRYRDYSSYVTGILGTLDLLST